MSMPGQHRWWYHGDNHKSESFLQSFRHASRGLILGAIFEANVRRQVLLFVLVIAAGLLVNITNFEWVVVLLTGGLVVTLEFVNSAIEALADAVHPGYDEHIQRAKDLSAAAVLTVSFFAFGAGLFIFLPRFSTITLWLANTTW
jgi:diacylglycerol kinase